MNWVYINTEMVFLLLHMDVHECCNWEDHGKKCVCSATLLLSHCSVGQIVRADVI